MLFSIIDIETNLETPEDIHEWVASRMSGLVSSYAVVIHEEDYDGEETSG